MEVVVKFCPGCEQLLLDDVPVCPGCGQDVASSGVVPLSQSDAAESAPEVAAQPTNPNERPCPRCGASVPKTLVKCPSCRTLMQERTLRYAGQGSGSSGVRATTAQLASEGDFSDASDVRLVEDPTLMSDLASVTSFGTSDSSSVEDDFEVGSEIAVHDFDVNQRYVTPSRFNDAASPGLVEIEEDSAEWQANRQAEYADDEGPAEYNIEGQVAEPYAQDGYDQPAYDQAAYDQAGYDQSQGLPSDDTGYDQAGYDQSAYDQSAYDQSAEQAAPPVVESPADPLLDAAMQEQAESGKRRRPKRVKRQLNLSADAFLVYCPNGHRIVVREQFRGRIGRCPNCRQPFFVPTESVAVEETADALSASPTGDVVGAYTSWILDVRLHVVNPTKLKLKEASLVGTHDVVDIGFSPEHMLLAVVFPGNTGFRSMVEAKKTVANREGLREHLAASRPLDQAPVPRVVLLAGEQFSGLRLVQPAVPGDESIFAGVDVFGPGRVVFRMPGIETNQAERQYLSFSLSQFRKFSEALGQRFGLSDLTPAGLIPETDEFEEATCHYSEQKIRSLKQVHYHRQDASIPLQLLGWKCAGCGLVVSEDSRRKEKIGGKSESSVAGAKCPKCKNKFGDQRLYGLKSEA
jgi:hypothetical protein